MGRPTRIRPRPTRRFRSTACRLRTRICSRRRHPDDVRVADFQDFVPAEDSLIVERLRQAGAIVVGKTNTPEFGAGSQTFNPVFGATLNPHDRTRTCGGSSGGAAVALATGMLPIADGSDMGGSLRNPASFCGIVGMRPSPGRVPVCQLTTAWSTLSVQGPMARSVADVALLLSAIAGPDARSPIAIDQPGSLFSQSLRAQRQGARIAWWTNLGGIPVERRVRDMVNAQRQVFESPRLHRRRGGAGLHRLRRVVFKTLRALAFFIEASSPPESRAIAIWVKETILWEIDRGEAAERQPDIASAKTNTRSCITACVGSWSATSSSCCRQCR